MTTRACNLNNDLFCFLFIYTRELICFFCVCGRGRIESGRGSLYAKWEKKKEKRRRQVFFLFFSFLLNFSQGWKKKMEETMDDDRRENVIVSSVSLVVRREGEEYAKSKGGAPLPQSFPASLLFLRLCFFLYLFLSLRSLSLFLRSLSLSFSVFSHFLSDVQCESMEAINGGNN